MKKVYEFFGGKKFFFTQEAFIVLSVLTYFGKVDSSGFIYGMSVILATYAGANVYQKKILSDGSVLETGTQK